MPTLRNIQGASLVPDIGPALGQVQQIMAQRRAQQQQDVLNQAIGAALGFPGAPGGAPATTGGAPGGERFPMDERPTDEGQWWNENPADMRAREAAMVRIAQINPQAAKVVGGILASRDARAQEQLKKESDDAVRVSSLLLGIDDPTERMQALSNVVRERQQAGQDVSRLLELSQLSPVDQNLRLRQNIVMGTDVKKLADMALKPNTPVRTWTTPEGQVIGQYRDGSTRFVDLPPGARVSGSAPQISVNMAPKLEAGFEWIDPTDPSQGVRPIRGGSKDPGGYKPRSTAEATMIANAQGAIKDLADATDLLFGEDDTLDRTVATAAAVGIPGTEGRDARQAMRRAVEVMLRMRTGAQAPAEEVDNYMTLYFPSPLDSDAEARRKRDQLRGFFSDTLELLRANGLPEQAEAQAGELSAEEQAELDEMRRAQGD